MNPLVSIIIPTFNRAHLIIETLDSIKAQTYTNWECIIIDDGSTDSTPELMQNYCSNDKRFNYFLRPQNRLKGANSCRNYGYELSRGCYINWFDDDDLMHENKISIQLESLENSNLDFSVCQNLIFKDSTKNILGLRSESIHSNDIFHDYLTQKVVWLTPSALWRKSFLQTINYLFDETLHAAQEWEFHCRVLYIRSKYGITNEALVYIREHGNSVTYCSGNKQRIWNYFIARWKIYKNNTIILDIKSSNYLKTYFINNFKNLVRERKFKESIKFFKMFILLDERITYSGKCFSLMAIFGFVFFNKGNILLSKIK